MKNIGNTIKRIVSAVLLLCMVFSVVPDVGFVFAKSNTGDTVVSTSTNNNSGKGDTPTKAGANTADVNGISHQNVGVGYNGSSSETCTPVSPGASDTSNSAQNAYFYKTRLNTNLSNQKTEQGGVIIFAPDVSGDGIDGVRKTNARTWTHLTMFINTDPDATALQQLYCIQKGVGLSNNEYGTTPAADWDSTSGQMAAATAMSRSSTNHIDTPQKLGELLGYVLAFGYHDTDIFDWYHSSNRSYSNVPHEDVAKAIATQLIMWEVEMGERDYNDFSHHTYSGYARILDCICNNDNIVSESFYQHYVNGNWVTYTAFAQLIADAYNEYVASITEMVNMMRHPEQAIPKFSFSDGHSVSISNLLSSHYGYIYSDSEEWENGMSMEQLNQNVISGLKYNSSTDKWYVEITDNAHTFRSRQDSNQTDKNAWYVFPIVIGTSGLNANVTVPTAGGHKIRIEFDRPPKTLSSGLMENSLYFYKISRPVGATTYLFHKDSRQNIITWNEIRGTYAASISVVGATGTVTGYKEDDAGNKVGGARIGLFPEGTTNFAESNVATDSNGNPLIATTVSSGSNKGKYTFNNVWLGKYIVREISAPAGYTMSYDTRNVIVEYKGQTVTVSQNFVNPRITRDIRVKKVDDNGNTISGIQFKLQTSSSTSSTVIATGTTDANGYVTFSNVPLGTYYIHEYLTSQQALQYTAASPVSVTITESSNPTTVITVTNTRKTLTIKVKKYDEDLPPMSNGLVGAEFELRSTDGTKVYTATTDTNGYAYFYDVARGYTYRLYETEAPAGYQPITGQIGSDIVVSSTSTILTITLPNVSNERLPDMGSIKVFKRYRDYDGTIRPWYQLYLDLYNLSSLDDMDSSHVLMAVRCSPRFGLFPAGTTVFDEEHAIQTAIIDYSQLSKIAMDIVSPIDANVYTLFESVPVGTYIVAEIVNPILQPGAFTTLPPYSPSSQHYTVTVRANRTATVPVNTFINTLLTGTITIVKTDDNGDPLGGATFGLYDTDPTSGNPTPIQTVQTSDRDGTAVFRGLVRGEYWVKETAAPTGYDGSTDVFYANVGEYAGYMEDGAPVYNLNFTFTTVNTKRHYNIHGYKYENGTNTRIEGAVFGLFGTNPGTNETPSSNALQTATTNANGEFTFANIANGGTYYIREITPPTGYRPNYTVYQVRVLLSAADGTTYEVNSGNGVPNTKITATVRGLKKNDNGETMSGVEFGLYQPKGDVLIQRATTNSSGVFTFTNVPYGTYVVKEIGTPSGYYPNVNTYPVTVDGSETIVYVNNNNAIINRRIKGTITITKTDNDGNALDEAVFGLFDANTTEFTASNALQTSISVDGVAGFADLELTTYKVVELEAPEGYSRDETVHTVTLSTSNYEITITAINYPNNGEVHGTKVDNSGNSIANVKFGIWTSDTANNNLTEANALQTTLTNARGEFAFTGLPYGSYKVKELAAPAQYTPSQTVYNVTVSASSPSFTISKPVVNNIKTATVTGTKTDRTTGEPLQGAKFGLYPTTATTYTSSNYLYTATSDANGTFTFTNVPFGTYILAEYEAPAGYVLNANPQQITLSDDTCTLVNKVYTYNAGNRTNTKAVATIVAHKVDNQNKPLENALFGLFDPATYTATSTANDALYTATSDNSGNVRFTNIPLGTYVLCELQAPTGYLTNRDPRTITLATHGQVHEETLAYTNEPAIGKIIAYKVDENNQPLAGAQFALFPEGTTTFSQANIALDANGNPLTATSTINGNKAEIVFNNVPFGNYILKEMSAPVHSNPNLNYNLALPINISLNENTATLTGGVYVYEIGTAIADTISQGEAAIIIRKNVLGPDDAQLATTYGAGAVFGLFAANETVFTAENALYLSTPVATSPFQYIFATGLGASGNGIPTGNYIIAEITPPVGTYIEPGIWFQSTTLSIATYDSARNVVLLNVGSDTYLGFINIRNRAISGSVTGHKVDETNNNIQGVVFGLFDVNETTFTTANALYTATTNASGTFTFDDVLYGEYRLVEIQSDINHYQAQYNRLITINTNGQVINVGNIENPLVRGNIKVIKTGANNTPLANAVFGIFAENETNFDTAHAIAVDTTDVNGYITFIGLPVGTYKVVELEAPEGYVLDSTPHTVVMPAPDHQLYVGDTYTYQNTPVEVTVSNVRKVGTITGRKVSSGSPLEGAVFGLFDLDGNELDRQTVTASGTNKGRFTFTNVPYPATYVVREITTPTGYTGTFVQTVTLTDATHDINLGNIDNPPYTVNLRGLKVDEHNNPLIGATFGLFKSNETTFTTDTALRTAISDANGYFTFTNVPIGNYIIRELAAPDSTYELDETNYTCEVTANTANNTLVVTVTNHKKLGSLIAHKTGYGEPLEGAVFGLFYADETVFNTDTALYQATSAANGNIVFTNVEYGSYKLREISINNIGYQINTTPYPVTIDAPTVEISQAIDNPPNLGTITGRKVDDHGNPLSGVTIQLAIDPDSPVAMHNVAPRTTTTNAQGIFTFTDCQYGYYIITETAGIPGYIPSNEEYHVILTSTGQNVNIEIENPQIIGSIIGSKVDDLNNPIRGAVFGLFATNVTTYTVENTIGGNTTATTNGQGVFEFPNVPYGTYKVAEISAPSGYLWTPNPVEVTITTQNQVVTLPAVENPRAVGTVVGHKVDENGNNLAGAVFGLFPEGTTDFVNTIPVKTATADGNGIFTFTEVPFGTYVLGEITAPANYQMSNAHPTVVVDTRTTPINIGDINNARKTGNIVGTKKDGDGNVLAGAIIGLYNKTTNEEVARTTTTAQGIFTFENIPYGIYYVKEIATPNNAIYVLSTTSIDVVLDDDHPSVNAGEIINEFKVGVITGTKIGPSGEKLAGAVFGLFPAGTTEFTLANTVNGNTTATTNAQGVFIFTDVRYGSYIVRELVAPANYAVNTTPYPATVSDDTTTVNVGNIVDPLNKGRITAHKVDDNNHALAGATFGLFPTETTTFDIAHTVNGNTTMTTGTDGIIVFENIDNGTYIIAEISAPTGYIKDSHSVTVTLSDAGQSPADASIVFENTQITSTITGDKKDDLGNPVQGVVFGLFAPETTTYTAQNVVSINGTPATATTNTQGVFTFNNVPYGTYKVVEISVPNGYVLDQTPQTATVTTNGATLTYHFVNRRAIGNISGIKYDQNGTPLANATFGLFPVGTTEFTTTNIATGTSVAQSGSNGVFTFTDVPFGTYVVGEISAPAGYNKATAGVSVTLDINGQTPAQADIVFNNTQITGTITGIKKGSDGRLLENAEFTLWQGATAVATAKTNAQGVFIFSNVPYGSYTITETDAPTGYVLNPGIWTADITTQDQVINIGEIEDPLLLSGITGIKHDQDGDNLAGATMGLFPVGTTTFDESHTLNGNTTAISGANGEFTFTNIPDGTYIIHEIAAPTGYVIGNESYTVTLTNGEQSPAKTSLVFVNTKILGTITGTKTDDDGHVLAGAVFTLQPLGWTATSNAQGVFTFENVPYGNYTVVETHAPNGYRPNTGSWPVSVVSQNQVINIGTIENPPYLTQISGIKKDQDGQPLAGATFGLYAHYGDTQTPIDTAISGPDGIFTFTPVIDATYDIREISAPTGYIPSNQVCVVTITNGVPDIPFATFVFTNNLIKGTITGDKKDDLGNPVQGVIFGLFNVGTTIYTEQTAIAVDSTNSQGVFTFSDVPYGTYEVAEISVPNGYVLDQTPQTATVTTNGATLTYHFVNNRAVGNITGTKVGETGNALEGVVFGLFPTGTTEFTSTNASYTATTQADGTFAFNDVPFGTYIVHEISTLSNYVLSNRSETVTIDESNYQTTIDVGTWTNTLARGTITGHKVDDDNNALAGAVFGLFPAGTTEFTLANTVNGNTTATTNAQGEFTFNDIVDGSYIVRELTAPTGYDLNTTAYPVTLVGGTANTTIGPVVNNHTTVNIIGTKVGPNGEPLANAVFGLFPAGTTEFDEAHTVNGNTTATTNAQGVFTFTGVRYGSYIVRELVAPTNYVLNTTEYPVTVDDNTVSPINVGNIVDELGTSVITGIKHDNHGAPLTGATFGLFPTGTTTFDSASAYRTAVSDTNGIFTFNNVAYGSYVIAELTAPEGYLKSTETVNVTLDEINGQTPVQAAIIFENTQITGSISGVKTDDQGMPVANVKFGLFLPGVTSYTSDNALYTALTNNAGEYSFNNIPYGTYQLVEIEVPAHIVLNSTPVEVVINTNGQHLTYNFVNDRVLGTIVGTKVGVNGTPLQGAVFTLQPLGWTAITNEQGIFTFENVPYGNYTVVETQAPVGYQLNSTPYTVSVQSNGETVNVGSISNDPILGTITGTKVDGNGNKLAGAIFTLQPLGWTATSNAQGVFTFENVPYGNYTIVETQAPEGHVASVTPYPASVTEHGAVVNIGEIVNPDIVGTITGVKKGDDGQLLEGTVFELRPLGITARTNASGVFTFNNVPYGTYTLVEIEATEGYLNSGYSETVTISTNGQTVDVGDITNPKIKGTITGRKVDEHNDPLLGATFGLFNVGTQTFTTDNALMTAISLDDGTFTFNDVPYGSYIVVEIYAPAGYNASTTGYPVTINETNYTTTIDLGDIVNYPSYGTITGIKKDSHNNLLQFAPFGLFANDETEFTAENALQIAFTDANGVFTFSNVAYGAYKVREIIPDTPNGILAWRNFKANNPSVGYNTTVYPVTITPAGGQDVEIVVINPDLVGSVKVHKIDPDGAPLAGVKFELYGYTDPTPELDGAIWLVGEGTTNGQGEYEWTNVPYGHYYIVETATIEGYSLDSTPHYVDVVDHLALVEVTVVNNPSPRHIDVTKRIHSDDINWANGNPIFIFRLGNTPASAGNDVQYLVLEFTQAYVEANAHDGWVEMTGTFDNLAPDQYVLTELDTMRYEFDSIDQVVNGTAVLDHPMFGNCVVFELAKKEYGAARFTNLKTRWDYSTDTDCVVNEIGH